MERVPHKLIQTVHKKTDEKTKNQQIMKSLLNDVLSKNVDGFTKEVIKKLSETEAGKLIDNLYKIQGEIEAQEEVVIEKIEVAQLSRVGHIIFWKAYFNGYGEHWSSLKLKKSKK